MSALFGRSFTSERLLDWVIVLLICNLALTAVTLAFVVDRAPSP